MKTISLWVSAIHLDTLINIPIVSVGPWLEDYIVHAYHYKIMYKCLLYYTIKHDNIIQEYIYSPDAINIPSYFPPTLIADPLGIVGSSKSFVQWRHCILSSF